MTGETIDIYSVPEFIEDDGDGLTENQKRYMKYAETQKAKKRIRYDKRNSGYYFDEFGGWF